MKTIKFDAIDINAHCVLPGACGARGARSIYSGVGETRAPHGTWN